MYSNENGASSNEENCQIMPHTAHSPWAETVNKTKKRHAGTFVSTLPSIRRV